MIKASKIPMVAFALLIAAHGCEQVSETGAAQISGNWLIPVAQIYDGGPGKDGIPALTNPQLTEPRFATYVLENDLVIGIKIGNEVRAYPHPILDWHEIINDDINGVSLAVTYCPLTGSGVAWSRVLNGSKTTFGVSGLLYNSNLIPYDRSTKSNWSQMRLDCVNGNLIGQTAIMYPIVETTWKTWQKLYPQTSVVSASTGYSRPYGTYPYGGYKESSSLIFPINNDDGRLPRKERVQGVIISGKAKVYQIGTFPESIGIVHDTFNGVPIVIAGSRGENFAVSFERTVADGTLLTFMPVQNKLPVVMVDQEETQWDIFGKAVEGPRAGAELKPTRSYIAYWFAWGTFYPGAEIHGK